MVASLNPVKVQAALEGLQRMFPAFSFNVSTVSVPSGVADQPMSDEETLQGAMKRVRQAREVIPNADLWVGIEGGVAWVGDEMAAFAWVVVQSSDLAGKARSGTFFLPEAVAALVGQGVELGEVDDRIFGRTNSKQAGGAIGILTDNVLDRKQLYEQAVVLALVPFRNASLYAAASASH